MKATTADAYRLMHEGSKVLAVVEANGIRIDTGRLDRTIKGVGDRIEQLTDRLKQDEVWKVWKRRFGTTANMGSRPQLGKVLFDELGYKPTTVTKTGRPKMDKAELARLDLPFVKRFLQLEDMKKLKSTYLMGVRREVVDGYLRPSFNLHLVRTYRSSSDSPNFQNIPIRDKQVGKLIRSCFIPRPGHVLVEIDYGALEVRVAACYNRDPMLMEYIRDPSKDMHRDMAAECYVLSKEQVTKEARFYAKNQFVFPEFYGSYYAQCAPNLWDAIGNAKLTTVDGVPLRDHLAEKGISKLGYCQPSEKPEEGSFEKHIQQVEQDFWGRRFKVYAQWKLDWFRKYQKWGWFDMLTGFRVAGVYGRNDVINYPVQGSAFHCLLWSLIKLVWWMRKKKMRSVVVGQIHDSIVADVHRDELDDYLGMTKRIMTEDIQREWKWLIVPLSIGVEIAETNWYEKESNDRVI